MTHWSGGYVSEIGYTHGYYSDLDPSRISVAFLTSGLLPPRVATACELGFGQGLSLNVHAAASVVRWHGTDFNPAHVVEARALAEVPGFEGEFVDEGFAEYAERTDLPKFDFIAAHGVWSWVSDDDRRAIVAFVRRNLAVGGVVYLGYNTLPGWSDFAPIRHLMAEHAGAGAPGRSLAGRIDHSVGFASELLALAPRFAQQSPPAAEQLAKAREHGTNYLAHEYFNRHWDPMYFSSVARWVEDAKVEFACSANLLDHVPVLHLTDEQRAFLAAIESPVLRETTRDVLVNQRFRKDYWVRGARRGTDLEILEAKRALRLVLVVGASSVVLKARGFLGSATLDHPAYPRVLELLGDHRPRSVGELEAGLVGHEVPFSILWEVVVVLVGLGYVALAQDEASVARARGRTDKLNAQLVDRARSRSDVAFLASPVTGGACGVSRIDQLFLLTIRGGRRDAEAIARATYDAAIAAGQHVVKDGRALEAEGESLAELIAQASGFLAERLPRLRALQVWE